MSVLALDTASRESAVALRTEAGGALLDWREVPGGDLDVRLGEVIAELLDETVHAVVVLTGPGSYSGVRAGMAAALGVAMARSLPLHGVGNLAAIAGVAGAADGERFRAVADAERGGVYVAAFVSRGGAVEQLSPVQRVEAATLDRTCRNFASAAIAGVETVRLAAVDVLAAAVPLALSRPPLDPAGLSATHAERPR